MRLETVQEASKRKAEGFMLSRRRGDDIEYWTGRYFVLDIEKAAFFTTKEEADAESMRAGLNAQTP